MTLLAGAFTYSYAVNGSIYASASIAGYYCKKSTTYYSVMTNGSPLYANSAQFTTTYGNPAYSLSDSAQFYGEDLTKAKLVSGRASGYSTFGVSTDCKSPTATDYGHLRFTAKAKDGSLVKFGMFIENHGEVKEPQILQLVADVASLGYVAYKGYATYKAFQDASKVLAKEVYGPAWDAAPGILDFEDASQDEAIINMYREYMGEDARIVVRDKALAKIGNYRNLMAIANEEFPTRRKALMLDYLIQAGKQTAYAGSANGFFFKGGDAVVDTLWDTNAGAIGEYGGQHVDSNITDGNDNIATPLVDSWSFDAAIIDKKMLVELALITPYDGSGLPSTDDALMNLTVTDLYLGTVPSGSYQNNCAVLNYANGILTARCSDGQRLYSNTLDTSDCQTGTDIENVNGQLRCSQYNTMDSLVTSGTYLSSAAVEYSTPNILRVNTILQGSSMIDPKRCRGDISISQGYMDDRNTTTAADKLYTAGGYLSCEEDTSGLPTGSYLNSCTNFILSGDKLSAACNYVHESLQDCPQCIDWGRFLMGEDLTEKYEIPEVSKNPSTIQYSLCKAGSIDNINGLLTCDYSASMNRGDMPTGNYPKSCTNISYASGILSADCKNANKVYVPTSIVANRCSADIDVTDGKLTCNNMMKSDPKAGEQYVVGYGNPMGPWRETCTNAASNGSTFTASCKNMHGEWVTSTLPYVLCSGMISNNDGHLWCGSYTYPIPSNLSYAHSKFGTMTCKASMTSSTNLHADCTYAREMNQKTISSDLDLVANGCDLHDGGVYYDSDGKLTCRKASDASVIGKAPNGSWSNSCGNASLDKNGIFGAQCKTSPSDDIDDMPRTFIDTRLCSNVENLNGKLRCAPGSQEPKDLVNNNAGYHIKSITLLVNRGSYDQDVFEVSATTTNGDKQVYIGILDRRLCTDSRISSNKQAGTIMCRDYKESFKNSVTSNVLARCSGFVVGDDGSTLSAECLTLNELPVYSTITANLNNGNHLIDVAKNGLLIQKTAGVAASLGSSESQPWYQRVWSFIKSLF